MLFIFQICRKSKGKLTPKREETLELLQIQSTKISDKNIDFLDLKDTEYRLKHYNDKLKEIIKAKQKVKKDISALQIEKLKEELEKEIYNITKYRIDVVFE